jgi:hypothetical protein
MPLLIDRVDLAAIESGIHGIYPSVTPLHHGVVRKIPITAPPSMHEKPCA